VVLFEQSEKFVGVAPLGFVVVLDGEWLAGRSVLRSTDSYTEGKQDDG
jgi:hypothetical protein